MSGTPEAGAGAGAIKTNMPESPRRGERGKTLPVERWRQEKLPSAQDWLQNGPSDWLALERIEPSQRAEIVDMFLFLDGFQIRYREPEGASQEDVLTGIKRALENSAVMQNATAALLMQMMEQIREMKGEKPASTEPPTTPTE